MGFSGMVLTDHFYHGNTGVDRKLPWEEFVRAFENAYLRAKTVGDALDFDVLFGVEENLGEGKEVLLYGITPAFLYAHPELRHARLPEIAALAHSVGAVVVQAHPFRVRDYIPDPMAELPAEYLDGAEVYNACNDDLSNRQAKEFADRNGLLYAAGSDAHRDGFVHRAGIACHHRIRTERELADTLRSGNYSLYTPEE